MCSTLWEGQHSIMWTCQPDLWEDLSRTATARQQNQTHAQTKFQRANSWTNSATTRCHSPIELQQVKTNRTGPMKFYCIKPRRKKNCYKTHCNAKFLCKSVLETLATGWLRCTMVVPPPLTCLTFRLEKFCAASPRWHRYQIHLFTRIHD
jgi:hypothetical protein